MNDGHLLLDAIKSHPSETVPVISYFDWAQESKEYLATRMQLVIDSRRLHTGGIGGYLSYPDYFQAPVNERKRLIDEWRKELLSFTQEFAICLAWLSTKRKRKTVDLCRTTYGYKHDVEKWCQQILCEHIWIPHGVFISAVLYDLSCSFKIEKVDCTFLEPLGLHVGISRRPNLKS